MAGLRGKECGEIGRCGERFSYPLGGMADSARVQGLTPQRRAATCPREDLIPTAFHSSAEERGKTAHRGGRARKSLWAPAETVHVQRGLGGRPHGGGRQVEGRDGLRDPPGRSITVSMPASCSVVCENYVEG